jgi:hypothetical protein
MRQAQQQQQQQQRQQDKQQRKEQQVVEDDPECLRGLNGGTSEGGVCVGWGQGWWWRWGVVGLGTGGRDGAGGGVGDRWGHMGLQTRRDQGAMLQWCTGWGVGDDAEFLRGLNGETSERLGRGGGVGWGG